MNGFSFGTIFRDNCNTLVIVSGSTVFDLGKLLAASGADSLPSGFGLSEMLDDWQHGSLELSRRSSQVRAKALAV
jgi:hypothetical protein